MPVSHDVLCDVRTGLKPDDHDSRPLILRGFPYCKPPSVVLPRLQRTGGDHCCGAGPRGP